MDSTKKKKKINGYHVHVHVLAAIYGNTVRDKHTILLFLLLRKRASRRISRQLRFAFK